MKNTLTPIELTEVLENLILDHGTEAVLRNLTNALRNRRDKSYLEWSNERTAEEVAREWDRQARLVSDAVQGLSMELLLEEDTLMIYYVQSKSVAGWNSSTRGFDNEQEAIDHAQFLIRGFGWCEAARVFLGRASDIGDRLIWDSRENG